MSGLVNANSYRLPFANGVFHCAVTSIPYWGLRAYTDNPSQVWGGNVTCVHEWATQKYRLQDSGGDGMDGNLKGTRHNQAQTRLGSLYAGSCSKCGAWLGCYGLEPSLDLYVANTVAIMREVARTLRDDGTLWLNIGDCYATAPNGRSAAKTKAAGADDRTFRDKPFSTVGNGLKPKDLCGVPWRVALALQADGWWLRRDVIWSKSNPMPESITDRPATSHEYIFMLTKAERYYFDMEAVKEPVTGQAHHRGEGLNPKTRVPTGWDTGPGSHHDIDGRYPMPRQNESFAKATNDLVDSRNLRSVWTINPQAYSGAHYATYPEALAERCILASTSAKGVCPKCGAPWKRVIEREHIGDLRAGRRHLDQQEGKNSYPAMPKNRKAPVTTGWAAACDCGEANPIPARVLDPFVGSGTTVASARRLGRQGYGVDLSLVYLRENALPRAMGQQTAESIGTLPLFSKSKSESAHA